jgi:hypothetical protein
MNIHELQAAYERYEHQMQILVDKDEIEPEDIETWSTFYENYLDYMENGY